MEDDLKGKILVMDFETMERRVLGQMIHQAIEDHPELGVEAILENHPFDGYDPVSNTIIEYKRHKEGEHEMRQGILGSMTGAILGAMTLGDFIGSIPDHQRRGVKSNKRYAKSAYYPVHGVQANERRMRQIAAGSLKRENGLDKYFGVDMDSELRDSGMNT